MNFSEAATGGVLIKKAVLKIFSKIHRKVPGLQLFNNETPTQMFSSEYCDIFKNTYFEGHLLKAVSDFFKTATEQWSPAASVLTFNLDNLLRKC